MALQIAIRSSSQRSSALARAAGLTRTAVVEGAAEALLLDRCAAQCAVCDTAWMRSLVRSTAFHICPNRSIRSIGASPVCHEDRGGLLAIAAIVLHEPERDVFENTIMSAAKALIPQPIPQRPGRDRRPQPRATPIRTTAAGNRAAKRNVPAKPSRNAPASSPPTVREWRC